MQIYITSSLFLPICSLALWIPCLAFCCYNKQISYREPSVQNCRWPSKTVNRAWTGISPHQIGNIGSYVYAGYLPIYVDDNAFQSESPIKYAWVIISFSGISLAKNQGDVFVKLGRWHVTSFNLIPGLAGYVQNIIDWNIDCWNGKIYYWLYKRSRSLNRPF